MSIPYCICTKIQEAGNIQRNKSGYREDTETTMPAKGCRDNRSRIMPRPYTYAAKHTAEIQRVAGNGVLEREKQFNDI